MFSTQENNRYNRHFVLPQIGIEGQSKLKNAKVLMIGAGGLGCPVLQYLTAAGVGHIGIVDKDTIDESNLQRQVLYTTNDIGKVKVEVAKKALSLQNPFVKVSAHDEFLTADNALSIISQYDIVVDGTDNFNSRYLINDACVLSNKPLVFGSIHKFEGQLSVFNYENGPTYRCLYPEAPSDIANCSEAGVLGVLPGIIGALMANEAIKIIVGIGEIYSGKLFVINALDLQIQVLKFSKSIYSEVKQLTDYDLLCESSSVKEISVVQLMEKIKNKEEFQLIDLRESYEQEKRMLNADEIVFGEILQKHKKINATIPVILFCKKGNRSQIAIKNLQDEYHFKNLHNLTGGADAWEE
ncbi:MAG: HesA/MoeB/ThiF family protein [Bacteroidota bacterium]|nr:HesA/MoeB/ThiF family protein [Bacteroidota bacterium]